MQKTKIIVITGGVFSSLGKGIIMASIGRILITKKFKVAVLKMDPYLNLDPGTMSPYQHGEVFVTHDGGETDLDLGHYERFLDYQVSKSSSLSAGRIYDSVLKKERNGDYQGKTVQIVPHVTDEIQNHILKVLQENCEIDFLLIEVGGTVGDIESLPFIEALRQFQNNYGRNSMAFIHASPLIDLKTSSELKTKPTQHSVRSLREHGIIPDFLCLRSSVMVDDITKSKIATSCGFALKSIFTCVDASNIYLIPEDLETQNVVGNLFDFFQINDLRIHLPIDEWLTFTKKINQAKKYKCRLAIVGKYVQLPDAYFSILESFKLASYQLETDLKIDLINAESSNDFSNLKQTLKSYDAICVPYGFGSRGIEGKIQAIKYCRENDVPFLGICLGMQLACIEFARNVLHWSDANSTEFNVQTSFPIFQLQKNKSADRDLGGTLRLGNDTLNVTSNTLAAKLYQSLAIVERHRHRYEFNKLYLKKFLEHKAVFSVYSAQKMVEVFELPYLKYFITCQYHPEFSSKPLKVNPLFMGLIEAARRNMEN